MKLLNPTTITNAMLTSSTVSEDDHAEWDVATTYDADDYVIVIGTTHKVYKSVVGSNLGNDPITDDGSNWTEQSATNRWKAFDQKISDLVEQNSSIQYVFDSVGLVDGFVLFGLEAETATLTVVNDSVEVYNETLDLVDTDSVVDGYTYDFEPISYQSGAIFPNLPPYTSATYTLTLTSTGTVKVGQVVIGRTYTIGESLFGTSLGILDYSRKDTDDFGNSILVQRAFAETVDFDVIINTSAAQRTRKLLSSVRATPAVYFADEDLASYGTLVYGFFVDFGVVLSGPNKSQVNIEVEGLT